MRMAHSGSMKVDVDASAPSGKTLQRLPTRRRRVQERLASLDTNQDGVVSKEELVDFIDESVHREAQFKYLKWAAILLLVFTIVLLGAVAGLVAGIVISVKDTKSANGALMDKGSGTTLRTASGGFMRVTLAPGANSTTAPGRRRLLQGGSGAVDVTSSQTIARAEVRQACTYLSEGNAAFPLAVNDGSTAPSISNVQILAKTNCAVLVSTNPLAAVSGIVLYQGQRVKVTCAAGADRCTSVFVNRNGKAGSTAPPPTTAGRRLQGLQKVSIFTGTGCSDASVTFGIGGDAPVEYVRKLLARFDPTAGSLSPEAVCTARRSVPYNTSFEPDPARVNVLGPGPTAQMTFLMRAYAICMMQTPTKQGSVCTPELNRDALLSPLTVSPTSDSFFVPSSRSISADNKSCQFKYTVNCVELRMERTFTNPPSGPQTGVVQSSSDKVNDNWRILQLTDKYYATDLTRATTAAVAANPKGSALGYYDVVGRVWGLKNQDPKVTTIEALNILKDDPERGGCFPAAATAVRYPPGGGIPCVVPLSQLRPGDAVQVVNEDGSLGTSAVYLFPHFETAGSRQFLEITTAAGQQIRLTDTHILYMAATPKQSFSSRAALPAAEVRVGQYVWVTATTFDAAASSATAKPSRIVSVRRVMDVGLVNPFTLRGNMVVNGVAASSYTTLLGTEAAMHGFCAAGRALWRRAPWLLRGVHRLRLAQPLSLAIGSLAQKGATSAGLLTSGTAALPRLPVPP